MKKSLLIGVLLSFVFASHSYADSYAFENISVTGAAKGFTSATLSTGIGSGNQMKEAVFIVESAPFRYRVDGTDPTSSVGTLAQVGDAITIQGQSDMENFSAIRTTATSAIIQPHFFNDEGN